MRRILKVFAVAGFALSASAAQAYIVYTWGYHVTSVFDTGTTVFTAGNGSTINTADEIAWGVPVTNGDNPTGQQSSLQILDNPADGVVNTSLDTTIDPLLGEVGTTQTFVHNNFVITIPSKQLDTVDVTTTLQLDPLVPDDPQFPPFPSITFNVNFQETPNAGPCANGTGGTPCRDIFVLSGNLDAFSFGYMGQTYYVQIFPFTGTPLVPLSNAACLAAGAPIGCIGFLTAENTSNEVQFAFAITTKPLTVPEPGSLALMAVGLLGIGLAMRRRSNKSMHA